MNKNKFDLIMDYIDININQKTEDIKKGMFEFSGVNSNTFDHCLRVLTGNTLTHYIISRKLFFASEALYNNPGANIVEIAMEYYSDQSAFTRAMKAFYDCTPGEIKVGAKRIPDEKVKLVDFSDRRNVSRIESVFEMAEEKGWLSGYNFECMKDVLHATEEYDFDFDTACAIADLAERLEMPIPMLMHVCFETYSDYQMEIEAGNILPLEDAIAIRCGIHSGEEIEEICKFYNCKIYDLDSTLVDFYYERKCNENL